MPELSVIVPVYNAKDTINRCISSILAQQYKDLEVIAVDDGSSDGSGELLDQLASGDARVHVIHKENGGVSKARNMAISHAYGTYIQFLDADDWIPENSSLELVRAMKNSDTDLAVGDFYRVIGESVSLKSSIPGGSLMTLEEYGEYMRQSPADFYYGVLWNKLYKASIIKENNLTMDESLSFCEDFIFNLEYLLHVRNVNVINVPVYYYLKTENSLAGGISLKRFMEAKNAVYQYYSQFYKSTLEKNRPYAELPSFLSFYLSSASDDKINPLFTTTSKLGEEEVPYYSGLDMNAGLFAANYYYSKYRDRYLLAVARKLHLELSDVKIFECLRNCDDHALIKELADYTGFSQWKVRTSLMRLSDAKFVTETLSEKGYEVHAVKEKTELDQELLIAENDFSHAIVKDLDEEELRQLDTLRTKLLQNLKTCITNKGRSE